MLCVLAADRRDCSYIVHCRIYLNYYSAKKHKVKFEHSDVLLLYRLSIPAPREVILLKHESDIRIYDNSH